jgi:phosphohistidine phosphatase
MKKLCLIRHAKSDWENETLADIDRPLNARGYQDALAMAKRMKAAGHVPQAIVSSTAVRAVTTALIFARLFGLDEKKIVVTPRLYDASEKQFVDVLKTMSDAWQTVFVFGHNPTISNVSTALGGDEVVELPTCGMAVLEVKSDSWKSLEKCRLLLVDFPKKADDLS